MRHDTAGAGPHAGGGSAVQCSAKARACIRVENVRGGPDSSQSNRWVIHSLRSDSWLCESFCDALEWRHKFRNLGDAPMRCPVEDDDFCLICSPPRSHATMGSSGSTGGLVTKWGAGFELDEGLKPEEPTIRSSMPETFTQYFSQHNTLLVLLTCLLSPSTNWKFTLSPSKKNTRTSLESASCVAAWTDRLLYCPPPPPHVPQC